MTPFPLSGVLLRRNRRREKAALNSLSGWQSEFDLQGVVIGSCHCRRYRFKGFQSSIIDMVDIMAQDQTSIVIFKRYCLQIQVPGGIINDNHALIAPSVEITGNN